MEFSVDASLCAQDGFAVLLQNSAPPKQSKAMIDEAPTLDGVTGDGQPDGTCLGLLAGDVEFALAKCP